jgi:hypothetical protein
MQLCRRPWHKVRVDVAIALLFVILGGFEVTTYQRIESFQSDSSTYITLARNLVETGRYEFNYQPNTRYPPGFPLLLACISVAVHAGGYTALIPFMPVFSTLALITWYFVLSILAGRRVAAAACLLTATSVYTYNFVTQNVLSDMPFFLVSGLSLLCLLKLEDRNRRPWSRFLLFGGALLFTLSAVLIRSAGITLCAGFLFWVLIPALRGDRRKPVALSAAVSAALVGLLAFGSWMIWCKRMQRSQYPGQYMNSYSAQFTLKDPHRPELGRATLGETALRVASNLPVQSSHIAALLTRITWVAPIWYSPLVLIPLVLLICGSLSYILDHGSLLAGYFLAYLGLYVLWPFDEGARFMLPVAPLAFVLIWRGLVEVSVFFRNAPARALGASALGAAFVVVGLGLGQHPRGLQALASVAFWLAFTVITAVMTFVAQSGKRRNIYNFVEFLTGLARSRVLQFAVVGLCLFGIAQQVGASRRNLSPNPSLFEQYPAVDCASWLRTAPKGALMAGTQAAILQRLTGRRVVDFPVSSDAQLIVAAMKHDKVRYLIVRENVKAKDEYFFPSEEDRHTEIQRSYPHFLDLVHSGRGYRVFETAIQ